MVVAWAEQPLLTHSPLKAPRVGLLAVKGHTLSSLNPGQMSEPVQLRN